MPDHIRPDARRAGDDDILVHARALRPAALRLDVVLLGMVLELDGPAGSPSLLQLRDRLITHRSSMSAWGGGPERRGRVGCIAARGVAIPVGLLRGLFFSSSSGAGWGGRHGVAVARRSGA